MAIAENFGTLARDSPPHDVTSNTSSPAREAKNEIGGRQQLRGKPNFVGWQLVNINGNNGTLKAQIFRKYVVHEKVAGKFLKHRQPHKVTNSLALMLEVFRKCLKKGS